MHLFALNSSPSVKIQKVVDTLENATGSKAETGIGACYIGGICLDGVNVCVL